MGPPLLGRLAFSLQKPLVDPALWAHGGEQEALLLFSDSAKVCVCVFLSDAVGSSLRITQSLSAQYFSLPQPKAGEWG